MISPATTALLPKKEKGVKKIRYRLIAYTSIFLVFVLLVGPLQIEAYLIPGSGLQKTERKKTSLNQYQSFVLLNSSPQLCFPCFGAKHFNAYQFRQHFQRKSTELKERQSDESEMEVTKKQAKTNTSTSTMEKRKKQREIDMNSEKEIDGDDKGGTPLLTSVGAGFGVKRAKTRTVNARLIKDINRELEAREAEAEEFNTKNSVDFDATLTEEEKAKKAEKERIEKQDEEALADLNGINPRFALFGSGFTLFLAFVFWRITQGMAITFNNLHIESDFYPVQRVANTASTALIGLAALGTGIFGGIGLGLTALTTRIIYGISTGELDPNKPRKATSKEIEEEMERRNPSMVNKDGKVKFTKPWWEETFEEKE